MTPESLEEGRRLLGEATPGPWRAEEDGNAFVDVLSGDGDDTLLLFSVQEFERADADLAVWARNNVGSMFARIKELADESWAAREEARKAAARLEVAERDLAALRASVYEASQWFDVGRIEAEGEVIDPFFDAIHTEKRRALRSEKEGD